MPKPTSAGHGVWHELRVLRTKDGQSLTGVAEAAGLSLSYLSDLERGRQMPSPEATRKIAQALNVPISVLERKRAESSDSSDSGELRDLIRRIVREELAAQAVAS